jgi:glycosyltransferase involved in cell wall biosynthesis
METLSCSAGYGQGGLGRHFAQLVEDARDRDELAGYFTTRGRPGDDSLAREVGSRVRSAGLRYTPVRFSRGWRDHVASELFDRAVAARIGAPVGRFVGFSGKALRSFEQLRSVGGGELVLQAPNSHVAQVKTLHARAYAAHGIERSWLMAEQERKALREYGLADTIVVNSEYVRESFLARGFQPERLERVRLVPDERFRPPASRPDDGRFRVVYVGSLTVAKGVALLVDVFRELSDPDAVLTLVGGVSTRPMRRFLDECVRSDPRIRVCPGDPLDHLQAADVYVHPSYEDGFGYAPAEAMATGLPVIVTEDTGVKEYVVEGVNGWVVPTGDREALLERLRHVYATRPRPRAEDVPDFRG